MFKKFFNRIASVFSDIRKYSGYVLVNVKGQVAYADLQSDAVTYIAEKTLKIAEKTVRLYELADKAKLPDANSKTFQYTRYERLVLPTSALTEGTTPSDTSMTISTVTAVAEQWGAVVTMTDVAQLTIKHKPLQKAIQLLGVQSAEVVEREIFKVLMGGTQIYFPGTVASRILIDTTDVPSTAMLSRLLANLRDRGALGLEKAEGSKDPELGDMFVGVCDTFHEQDISNEASFVDASKYNGVTRLWNGEIGKWKGVRWLRTNLFPTLTSAAAATTGDNTADNGTITFNVSVRVMVTGTDSNGYERVIYQSSEQDTANDANAAHTISVTMPSTAGFTYSIYASAATALNDTTTSTAMTLQGSGFAPSAVIKIGSSAGTASASRLQLTTTGAAAPAQLKTAASKVHIGFVIGKEAYTCVDLQTLQSTLTPNEPSDSDPLKQRRKAGWKTMFKAVINNNDFICRFEAESAYD